MSFSSDQHWTSRLGTDKHSCTTDRQISSKYGRNSSFKLQTYCYRVSLFGC